MKFKSSNTGIEMNLSLLYRGLNPRAVWHRLVATQISKLQNLASIVSARITLERLHQSTPPWRVMAVLEVPGPDFHAEASDYTLRAALLKVVSNLRRQMQTRKNYQISRRKNDPGRAPFGRQTA